MFLGHHGESQITIVNDRTHEWNELPVHRLFEEFVMHKDLFTKRKVTLEELREYSWYIDDNTEGYMKTFTPFFILMGDWRIAYVLCGKNSKGEPDNTYLPSNMEEQARWQECSEFYGKEMNAYDDYDEYVLTCMLEDIVSYLDKRDAA